MSTDLPPREEKRQVSSMLRWMPNWLEFPIVIVVAFGLSIYTSIVMMLSGPSQIEFSNAGLIDTFLYEVFLIAVLIPFLQGRGWSIRRIGFVPPRWPDLAIACLLVGISLLSYYALATFAMSVAPHVAQSVENTSFKIESTAVVPLAFFCLLNGFFEETFVCAYVIRFLRENRGETLAVNVSVVIRVSYHLYQGPVGVLGLVPLGLVAGYWYSRTGRLTPLVVAHAVEDFFAFL